MLSETRKRILTNPVFKVVRWTVPWVVLVGVLVVTAGYWTDFQRAPKVMPAVASSDGTSSSTTSSVDATNTVPAGTSAVALMDGIRLRITPTATGQIVASVGRGTTMVVLQQQKDWLKVRDTLGRIGWITSSPEFVQLTIAR